MGRPPGPPPPRMPSRSPFLKSPPPGDHVFFMTTESPHEGLGNGFLSKFDQVLLLRRTPQRPVSSSFPPALECPWNSLIFSQTEACLTAPRTLSPLPFPSFLVLQLWWIARFPENPSPRPHQAEGVTNSWISFHRFCLPKIPAVLSVPQQFSFRRPIPSLPTRR